MEIAREVPQVTYLRAKIPRILAPRGAVLPPIDLVPIGLPPVFGSRLCPRVYSPPLRAAPLQCQYLYTEPQFRPRAL